MSQLKKQSRGLSVGAGNKVEAMEEQRFIEIETKLAHQEDLLDELNAVVTDQQGQISRLEELCRSLISRVRSLRDSEADATPQDERPPHY